MEVEVQGIDLKLRSFEVFHLVFARFRVDSNLVMIGLVLVLLLVEVLMVLMVGMKMLLENRLVHRLKIRSFV